MLNVRQNAMIHEDDLPGHESALTPKPHCEPRYPRSDRLKGKVALITGASCGPSACP
jgi:hypothetical protein